MLISKRMHANTLRNAGREVSRQAGIPNSLSTDRVRCLSNSTSWSASWWDIGNMGNYGQPGHYEQPANGTGSMPKDHVTRTWDKRNIQNTYSKTGREAKMHADFLAKNGILDKVGAADGGGSAISERDVHRSNRHAMHTHPEAPGPVIGMNDERGARQSGTINDPLGDSMRGQGTQNVPYQTNEMLMKWKISEESIRAADDGTDLDPMKTIPPSTREAFGKWEAGSESRMGGPTGRLDD